MSDSGSLLHNPNAAADPNAGIFGLPHSFDQAKLIYIPIPWEATTSYGKGTAYGPQAILNASSQIDLFDLDVIDPYQQGMHCLPISSEIFKLNSDARRLAQTVLDVYGDLEKNPELKGNLDQVNQLSRDLNTWVKETVKSILDQGKIAALIGGDHSTPFGAFQAAAEKFGKFGILHFDAHSDTRNAYMGFEHSHASIMFNAATKIPQISKFVQVGIRDFCEEEYEFTKSQGDRFSIYYDQRIHEHRLSGKPFEQLAEAMISKLPENVWVSFDIDGLDPRFCPHTGTPVPGGLDYPEALYILKTLAKSGRKIIGFDVLEVAPRLDKNGLPVESEQAADEWDANVGMRLIYKLSGLTLASQKLVKWR